MQNISCDNEFHLCEKKITFLPNSLALSLALKRRLWATRKWPILVVGERMFYYKLSDSCFTEIVLQVLYVILLSLNWPHISPQNGMETLRNEKTPNSFPQMLYFVFL